MAQKWHKMSRQMQQHGNRIEMAGDMVAELVPNDEFHLVFVVGVISCDVSQM